MYRQHQWMMWQYNAQWVFVILILQFISMTLAYNKVWSFIYLISNFSLNTLNKYDHLSLRKVLEQHRKSNTKILAYVLLYSFTQKINQRTKEYFLICYLEKCSPAGLLDLSSCVPGNPRIYASQSHFLNSPNALVNSVVGMAQPSLITDQTFLDLEPLSGVIVNAERRSQLNVGVLNGKLK